MMRRVVNSRERRKLFFLWVQGHTHRSISKKTGYSISTVYKHLHDYIQNKVYYLWSEHNYSVSQLAQGFRKSEKSIRNMIVKEHWRER